MKPDTPTLWRLAHLYFRVGNTTFGSGITTVALLSREITERNWLERWQCDLYYTFSRVVPGTNLLAFVAATAYALRGWRGSVVSVLALSGPASLVVVLLTLAYQRWHDHPIGGHAIGAAVAAIVGIIVGAAFLLAWPRFRPGHRIRTTTLASTAALLSLWLSPVTILVLAAVTGYFWRSEE